MEVLNMISEPECHSFKPLKIFSLILHQIHVQFSEFSEFYVMFWAHPHTQNVLLNQALWTSGQLKDNLDYGQKVFYNSGAYFWPLRS